MREQAALRIPNQLLVRQPPRALDETAFHLPARDTEINRVADIVQNIDPTDVSHAGEAIDFDLTDRSPDRKIMKRLSAPGRTVVMNFGSLVKAGRSQARAREISAL